MRIIEMASHLKMYSFFATLFYGGNQREDYDRLETCYIPEDITEKLHLTILVTDLY